MLEAEVTAVTTGGLMRVGPGDRGGGFLMRVRFPRVAAFVLAVALFVPLLAVKSDASSNLRVGTIWDGVSAELLAPTSMPPGSNDWSCHPSAAHPNPVILVHGTLANEAFSWQALSPMLANAGYCVYGFNYGATSTTLGHFFGMADIAQSAGELSGFVTKVLAATGASKADLVGHSQGGMMPRYYLKYLGGASKVKVLVGLAPSNHGTTILGLSTLLQNLKILGMQITDLIGCTSCTQQIVPSTFLNSLNAGGDTVPGPQYVVIESKYD